MFLQINNVELAKYLVKIALVVRIFWHFFYVFLIDKDKMLKKMSKKIYIQKIFPI